MSVSIGPLVISWVHILFFVAYLIALAVGAFLGRRSGVSVEPILTRMLIAGLTLARIVFVVQYWSEYRTDLIGLIDIRDGGFSLVGGVVGSLLVAAYYIWRQPKVRVALISAVTTAALAWTLATFLYSSIQTSQQLPQLEYQTLTNESVTLTQLNDKPMVINLWATWCPPCRREMPTFMQAQQERPDINFVFINQGELKATINQFLQKEQLMLDNVLLDANQASMQKLGTAGLPSTLFYSADGLLMHTHMGELSNASLNHALKKLTP